jgi:rhamnose transport system ATP-binding protein
VGRELDAVCPKRTATIGDVALQLRGVGHRPSGVHDVSLSVRRGEILGIAGLVGSGRTELAEVIFGLRPADSGQVLLGGSPVQIASPAMAIGAGIGYVPEDRRRHGVIPEMSAAKNASLASLAKVSNRGMIDTASERASARAYVEQLRIKTPSVDTPVEALSGGNQQKIALARWLATSPTLLILDEPTQGVDVGSKAEIHELMGVLAARGLAIIMISSEMPEILGMSDRIAVMHAGTIRGVFAREEATQARILELALGHGAAGPSHD